MLTDSSSLPDKRFPPACAILALSRVRWRSSTPHHQATVEIEILHRRCPEIQPDIREVGRPVSLPRRDASSLLLGDSGQP